MTIIIANKKVRMWFAHWPNWHTYASEPRVRLAWWWLLSIQYGNFVIRICGLTLQVRQLEKQP